jgi:hypothetical protein
MQEFVIAPVAGRGMWLVVLALALIFALVLGVVSAAILSVRSPRFEVSSAGLRLRGDLWGRLIPAAELQTGGVARVDLSVATELEPHRRSMATRLPGYTSGWFTLANGTKALVYLTDASRAVYVPTTAGYAVLVTPADPDGLVAALRGIGATRGRDG